MKYQRNNRPALFDKYRNILIPETPEERVRQSIAEMLERDFLVPPERITTEFPLSRLDSKSRRRADIVVWAAQASDSVPLIVVEVKAPHIPLTDNILEQAMDYVETLGCKYFGITNGAEHKWYAISDNDFGLLSELPKYSELITEATLEFAEPATPLQRLPLAITQGETHFAELIADGIIGQDTDSKHYPFISELDNFLLTEPITDALPLNYKQFTIIEDLGLSYRAYGNAAGGSWPGVYRGFLLQDGNGDHQIYRLAIMGKGKFVNHPTFKNSNAHTVLIVAVDDFDRSHNSLQMNLDKSIVHSGNSVRIIHDGKITVGNKGGHSPEVLFDFIGLSGVERLNPLGGIELGVLPIDRSMEWANDKLFVLNLLNYAYMRDEFRKSKLAKGKR
jgi:hypothetical protein